MTQVNLFNGQLKATFNRRCLHTFLMTDDIARAIDIESMQGHRLTIAENFATFWARTESIEPASDSLGHDASKLLKFWNKHSGKSDYNAIFNAFILSLDLVHNNAWLDAFNRAENSEIGRIHDPDLQSPELLVGDTLQLDDVKKNVESTENSGVSE